MTRLRRARARINDVLAVAGLVLVAYGLGLYSPPLTPIIVGLGLILLFGFGPD
jgi:hypothetical protein